MKKLKVFVIVVVIFGLFVAHYKPITENFLIENDEVSQVLVESNKKVDEAKTNIKTGLNRILNAIKNATGYTGEADTLDSDNVDSSVECESFKLIRVVDGDTIVVDNNGIEAKVRLIGIDTPESVNPDESQNNEYGDMASDYTKTLLSDIEYIYLTYDVETTDQYGRILAYAWLSQPENVDSVDEIENKMLNYIITADGYAVNKIYMPNCYYAMYLEEARTEAEEQGIGLWQYNGYKQLVE